MPLVANDAPASFLSLVIGENEVSWLGSAGIVIVGAQVIWKRLAWNRFGTSAWPTLFAATLAIAAIFVCQNSYSVAFHRLALTPERLLAWILATALMLPFWLGFDFLVRRGGIVISTVLGVLGVLGRAIIIIPLFVGVTVGLFPGVLFLAIPIIVLQFVGLEILATSVYGISRNLFLIALVESASFAWVLARNQSDYVYVVKDGCAVSHRSDVLFE
jgi:hypothetical protein